MDATRARSPCRARCSAGRRCRSRRTGRPRRPGRGRRSGVTTSGFLPPSSRQAVCRCRPVSAPISRPTADEPVKPTLSIRPGSSACSSPAKVAGPSACTMLNTPSGSPPPRTNSSWNAAERDRGVLGRLPDDRVAGQQRGHDVPGRHGDREVAGGDDRDGADRLAEGEQLLVRHLARHGLPVQPATLAEEEVAGVDDLAHLAERLGVRLADLGGDQPGQRLGVVLDQPADVGDRPAADRGRDRGPARLRLLGRLGRGDEGVGVGRARPRRRPRPARPGWCCGSVPPPVPATPSTI